MNNNKHSRRIARLGCTAAAVAMLGVTGAAQAASVQVGDGGVLRWGNILRYNLGVRMEKPDAAIASNASTDEGTNSYDQHEIVNNRLDWYTELNYDYQGRYGFWLSGSAWYNAAFNDRVKTGPGLENRGSYINNRFSDHTKRYHEGPYGELLDAYVYANFSVGDMIGDVKVGRQTNLWGEAITLSTHSVSYAQAPIDGLKAAASPGVDAREISMPIGQIHTTLQVNDRLTLAAQYFFEWDQTRLSEGGTYLASTDFLLEGPDRFSPAPGVFLANRGVQEPDSLDEFGLSMRYDSAMLGGTVGLYFRQFDERSPTVSLDMANGTYKLLYPEKTRLYGLSFSKLIKEVSVGAELVYREDTALASSIADGADDGARGNTWHAMVNGVKNYGPNALWSSASLTAELAFSHLDDVTSGEQYFNGCSGTRDVDYGCATQNVWVAALRFAPSWVAIAPGWDMGGTASVSYGLYGNSAVSGGGNENAGSYSIGPSLTYNGSHVFSLSYIDYLATHKANPAGGILYSNGSQLQDRGWLSFTYSGTF